MGNEESRLSSTNKTIQNKESSSSSAAGGSHNQQQQQSIINKNTDNNNIVILSWTLQAHCSLKMWHKHKAAELNFACDRIACACNSRSSSLSECSSGFCSNSQTLVVLRRSRCRSSLQRYSDQQQQQQQHYLHLNDLFPLKKRAKITKVSEHFVYNHIPAHLSSVQNFHFKSILCHRNGIVIVHLSRDQLSVFGVVDLLNNKFRGKFGCQRVDYDSQSVEGEISPDETLCLLRLPSSSNNRHGAAFATSPIFQLYNVLTLELVSEISLLSHPFSLFAFDPRFSRNRLVISDSYFPSSQENIPFEFPPPPPFLQQLPPPQQQQHQRFHLSEGRSFTLWNCVSWQTLASQWRPLHSSYSPRITQQRALCRLRYTPSGHLLLAVYVDDSNCRCASIKHYNSMVNSWLPRRSSSHTTSQGGGAGGGGGGGGISNSTNILLVPPMSGPAPISPHPTLISSSSPSLYPFGCSPSSSASSSFASSLPTFQSIASRLKPTTTTTTIISSASSSNSPALSPPPPPPPPPLSSWLVGCRIVVLHSDSLQRLRMLEFSRLACPLHSCPINFTPHFSQSGAKLAVIHNTQQFGERVLVYCLQPPPTLKAIARERIWSFLTREQIQRLNLPLRLMDFLLFRPAYNCSGSCIVSPSTSSLSIA